MIKTIFTRLALLAIALIALPSAIKAGQNVIFTTPEEYQIFRISPNGQWACGMYTDYSNNMYAFRWNLISGKTELLTTSDQSEAWSISNDGVVCGAYTVKMDGQTARSLPAIYDGEWHVLELPTKKTVAQGIGYDITPDGHYVTGSIAYGENGPYEAYVWKDGKLDRQLSDFGGGCPMPYCISPDGQTVGGWKQNRNRQACLWNADGTATVLSTYESPWSCARRFSPNGQKVVIWGGWNDDNTLSCIYDMTTQTTTNVAPFSPDDGMEFFDISDNDILVGEINNRAVIYDHKTTQLQWMDSYLTSRGVDLKDLDAYILDGTTYYQIIRGSALSADGSVMAFLYYANSQDNQAALRSAVIKFDVDAASLTPADLRATQLDGSTSARLTWNAPAGVEGIIGYRIYRNGQLIATTGAAPTSYNDKDLQPGTYTYQVSFLSLTGESKLSNAATLTIQGITLQAPQALFARQRGFAGTYISWAQPKSNLVTKTYTDINTAQLQGFGAQAENFSFEVAIRFSADEVKAYEGHKLSKVNFYPMSPNKDWKVNIYTYDPTGTQLQLLHTQPITQPLRYGQVNTVVLDQPVDLPEGDLVVAIGVTIDTPNLNVIGMDYGKSVARFSDLLRASSEPDFYSMEEMSLSQGYMSSVSWLIDAILTKGNEAQDIDVVDHYVVYADGTPEVITNKTQTIVPHLTEGTHTIGVSAVYANGSESAPATISQTIAPNAKALTKVDSVAISFDASNTMTARWSEPLDFDPSYISYSGETPYRLSANVPDGSNSIQFAHDYPSSMLKSYHGYAIRSARFYPLSEATFTILVYENGELIAEQGVESVNLKAWNEVPFEEPVTIKSGATYRVVIDCYDVEPGTQVVAVDNELSYEGKGDLYSLDGSNFESLSAATDLRHNVMLGISVEDTESCELPVTGYDVRIDGQKANTFTLTEPTFAYTIPGATTGEKHTLSVDTYYEAQAESVKGGAVNFTIGQTTGINGHFIADLTIRQTNATLTVAGPSVEAITILTADGAEVATAQGHTVPVGHLAQGIYLVQVKAAGHTTTRKIRIHR